MVAKAVLKSLRSRPIPAAANKENEKPKGNSSYYNLTGDTTTTG
jgi:hypothetical protein